jgi:hypothetical protein
MIGSSCQHIVIRASEGIKVSDSYFLRQPSLPKRLAAIGGKTG